MNRRNDWKKSSRACLLVGVFALLITSGRLSAAEGPPEIAATSPVIQPYGPFIVYGDGFDRDGVECGLLYRDRAVDNAAGTNELRAWLSEAMAGRVKLPEAGWLWRAPLAREKHRVMVNSEPLPRPDDKDMPEYEKDRRSLGVLNPGAAGPLGLRVRAVGSVSVDFIANQPEIWACSPRRPVTGEVCQFWGINLGGKAALVDEKGAIAGMADAVQGYHEHSARVEARFFRGFVVPEDIKPGKYRLYNWAGLGAAGWSAPLEVEVVNPKPLPKNQVNVREVGALGDGLNDDTAIFDKAISMVANTGGRIFIPPGRYRITRWLCLPQNVELCGVSPESTILVVSMTDEGGPFETRGQGRFRKAGTLGGSGASPVIWLKSGGVLRDLTIDGSGAGVQQSFALVLVGENGVTCRDAAIINCRLVYNKPYQIPCAGIIVAGGPGPQAGKAGVTSDALRVEDCKFSVNSLCLQYIKDGRHIGASIRRNFFTTIPPHGAAELICPNGTEGCLYEANIFENGGRTKTEQCSRPSSGNATVQHNCWRLNIIRNGRKGDGETIMYETGSAGWYGKAKGATADTLTALDTDRWWPAPDKKGAWQTNEFAGGYCVIV
ncbi:MAG: glycosyl hydrolase family 28-related protein, partial [Kiritimatiellota bacterium]|nr:glycosyl hydrolase family 28-related protein [Kiritimatiellota bacterium]